MAKRRAGLLVAAVAASVALAGCGGDDGGSADAVAAAPAPIVSTEAEASAFTIIDVRTPQEFAAGHLAGAINLNVEDGTLQAALADLDPAGSYVVYCRSGRRSALAAEAMAKAGFTNVQDLGAVEAAAATLGVAVVTG